MSAQTALLVIDVQQSFLHRPYYREDGMSDFRNHLLKLIDGAASHQIPIVHIFHSEGETGPFSKASGLVKGFDWLPANQAITFEKHVHNSFTDTELSDWLAARGITRLVVSGLRTEQCCETTTRVASDLGYQVDFVTEATGTFPMIHPLNGREFSTREIKEKTELVLADRFATVKTVEQVLADWQTAPV
ncbi:isochorismatase family protein [Chitinivorax sp. B]|uniref:isochorismatase family protein n=1 Tax=Chitinivorax sp. B TaxID=2502235 RepID=UPI0010F6DE69|nr:isochorismatase family protein [Chitinivorax sp. B]